MLARCMRSPTILKIFISRLQSVQRCELKWSGAARHDYTQDTQSNPRQLNGREFMDRCSFAWLWDTWNLNNLGRSSTTRSQRCWGGFSVFFPCFPAP